MDKASWLKKMRGLIITIDLRLLTEKGQASHGLINGRKNLRKQIARIKSGVHIEPNIIQTLIEKIQEILVVKPMVNTESEAQFEDMNMDLFSSNESDITAVDSKITEEENE